ncbi:tyrosine--tRNA ligase [bacterium]|nr:tyrosine--tRNA ligase [bacterium]
MTIGIDFINKKDEIPEADSPLAGLTLKLLLKSDGTKFGKSEKGAIYLSDKLVSPYTMYQFLINQTDADSQRLLNYLTDYSIDEIKAIIEKAKEDPSARYAQNKLAENIVTRVHGQLVYAKVKNLSSMIFGTNANELTVEDINLIKNDFPMVGCAFVDNEKLVDLLTKASIFKSKSELRTLIKQGGLRIGGKKITDENAVLTKEDTIANKYLIVQKGKKDIYILENVA